MPFAAKRESVWQGYEQRSTIWSRETVFVTHRIWIHADSGLLLKAATLGFKREVFDLYAFSQLVLGAQVDRNQLKPVNPVKPVKSLKQLLHQVHKLRSGK